MASLISRFTFALNADSRVFNREMRKGSKTITDQERAVRQLQRTVHTTGQRFSTFRRDVVSLRGALIGVAAVGGFLRLAQESTKAATALVELADRTGFATDRLQTLSRVFEGDGVSVEAFSKSIDKMNRVIYDAGLGLSTALDALDKIGLDFEQLQELKPEEQFDRITEGIARLSTESERTGVVQNIFGKGALGFINVLERGTEHLREQERAFRELGITNEAGLRALKDLNQEFTNLSTTLRVSLQRSFADSADELAVLIRELQELIRVGTPFAIQGISGATGIAQSAVDNSGALQTGILSYLGVKGVGAIASGAGTLATALGGQGALAKSIAAMSARIAGIATGAGSLVVLGTLLYTFREQLERVVNSISGIRSTDFTPQRLEGRPQLENVIRNLQSIADGIEGLDLEANSDAFLRNIVDRVRETEIFNQDNINQLFTRLDNQRFLASRNTEDERNQLIVNEAVGFVNEALASFRQQLEDLPTTSTQPTPTTTSTSATDELERQRVEREALNRLAEEEANRQAFLSAREQEIARTLEAQLDVKQRILELSREVVDVEDGRSVIQERINELNNELEILQDRLSNIDTVDIHGAYGIDSLHDDFIRTREQVALLKQEIAGLHTSLLSIQPAGVSLIDSTSEEELQRSIEGSLENVFELGDTAVSDYFLKQLVGELEPFEGRIATLRDITSDWFDTMKDGFANAILQTDSFGDALRRLGRYSIVTAIGAFLNEESLRGLFGGKKGKQFGGHIGAGELTLVGEDGPEYFVPKSAGDIVPIKNNGSGGIIVNFSPVINSTDGPGVRAALRQAIPTLKREILQINDRGNYVSMSRNREL